MAQKLSLNRLREDINKTPTGLKTADGYQVADRVVRYCIENRISDPFAGNDPVITKTHMDRSAAYHWDCKVMREYLTSKIPMDYPDEDEEPDCPFKTPGTRAFDMAAANLLAKDYICCPLNDGGLTQLYKVTDWAKREVAPVMGTNDDLRTVISQSLAKALVGTSVGVTAKRADTALLAFKSMATMQEPPQLLGQADDNRWCLHRATITPDATMEFPHIWQFLDRLNDAEAFAAWIWGVYSGLNLGRQSIYLQGLGEGGKSKFLAAIITALFGNRIQQAYYSNKANASGQFAASAFVGKRIVTIGDCANPYILLSPLIKSLLGEDHVLVEPKYRQPFDSVLNCRVIITTNFVPVILRERQNLSRTLYLILRELIIEPKDVDPHYGEKCVKELPGFLAFAKACYERLCPNHYAIEVNDAVKAATELRVRACETLFSVPFSEHFIVDEGKALTAREWLKVCQDILKWDEFRMEAFATWISSVHANVVRVSDPNNPTSWLFHGLRRNHGGYTTNFVNSTTAVSMDDVP